MLKELDGIRVVAFDADDTLWDCQSHFDRVEQECARLLAPWVDGKELSRSLFATERQNMPLLGYGTKAFTLSLLETALRVTNGQLPGQTAARLLEMGKGLLSFPATPLEGVTTTLERLLESGRYRMVVFTKGELLDQENKLKRSGLSHFFEATTIVTDKDEAAYRQLCRQHGVEPKELLMVGNSFRSDIAPAVSIGAWAVHVPFSVVWELEKSDEFAHERVLKIERFSQLSDLLL